MAKVTIRPAVAADIYTLARGMRSADRQEVAASHGPDIEDAIRHALLVSSESLAMEVDGQLALLGGVAIIDLLGGQASPWVLGTDLLERHPGALTRACRQYILNWKRLYPVLFNYVDARNTRSQRWLQRLGFTIAAQPVPYGVRQLPFYRFEMRS